MTAVLTMIMKSNMGFIQFENSLLFSLNDIYNIKNNHFKNLLHLDIFNRNLSKYDFRKSRFSIFWNWNYLFRYSSFFRISQKILSDDSTLVSIIFIVNMILVTNECFENQL